MDTHNKYRSPEVDNKENEVSTVQPEVHVRKPHVQDGDSSNSTKISLQVPANAIDV